TWISPKAPSRSTPNACCRSWMCAHAPKRPSGSWKTTWSNAMPSPLARSEHQLDDCSILLLAGGRGRRMGGKDKGWVQWQGMALIEHLHRTVRPLTDDLIISCNRNQDRYADLADQLVHD